MSKDKNDYIWHYTSVEVLQKFMEDNSCLYATHYRFLNDDSEGTYNLSAFFDYIKNDNKYAYSLPYFMEYMQKADFYLFCFSRAVDNLYQWRSYTPSQGGIAVAFSKEEISAKLAVEFQKQVINDFHRAILIGLEPCRYKNKAESFSDFVEAFEYFKQIAIDDQEAEEMIFSILLNQLRLHSIGTKNPSFSFEEEERLIYSTGNLREKLQFIAGKPRIPTCITNVRNYIKEIMISPHGDIERNSLFVELLRDKYRLEFPITASTSSYNGR